MHKPVASLVVVFVLAACSSGSPTSSTPPSGATTNPPDTTVAVGTSETSARPTGPEGITFPTGDGLVLEGRIVGSGSTWVVLGHMLPADMTSWFPFAEAAASAGYTALTYNNRGYGDSDGDKNDPRLATDAEAALQVARSRGAQRIFFFGASMNGAAALAVAAAGELAGIATLSGVPEFGDTNGIDVISGIEEPKLFVAAQDDFGAVDDAREFFDRSSEPKELLIFDVGGHGTDMFGANEGLLTETLLRFIADH